MKTCVVFHFAPDSDAPDQRRVQVWSEDGSSLEARRLATAVNKRIHFVAESLHVLAPSRMTLPCVMVEAS